MSDLKVDEIVKIDIFRDGELVSSWSGDDLKFESELNFVSEDKWDFYMDKELSLTIDYEEVEQRSRFGIINKLRKIYKMLKLWIED